MIQWNIKFHDQRVHLPIIEEVQEYTKAINIKWEIWRYLPTFNYCSAWWIQIELESFASYKKLYSIQKHSDILLRSHFLSQLMELVFHLVLAH